MPHFKKNMLNGIHILKASSENTISHFVQDPFSMVPCHAAVVSLDESIKAQAMAFPWKDRAGDEDAQGWDKKSAWHIPLEKNKAVSENLAVMDKHSVLFCLSCVAVLFCGGC